MRTVDLESGSGHKSKSSAAAQWPAGLRSRLLWAAVVAAGVAVLALAGQGTGLAARSAAAACRNPKAQPPSVGSVDVLSGVTVTSGCRAWAVGHYIKEGRSRTLIEYWNGRAWRLQKSPNPGRYGDSLNAVAAASPKSAWAVGYSDTGPHAHPRLTLILHWNGKAWKVQKSPSPGTHFGDYSNLALTGVTALRTSPTRVWAVGAASYRAIGDQPLIEYWNGRAWKVQKSPSFPPVTDCCYPKGLSAVGAGSRTNAWAVGFLNEGSGYGPHGLIEHWDGRAWRVQPGVAGFYSQISGVVPSRGGKAWVAGTYALDHCGSSGCVSASDGVIGRWSGTRWKIQKSPNPGRFNELRGVAQTTLTNAWAVGFYCAGTRQRCSSKYRPLIEHWNGRAWRTQRAPDPESSTANVYLYGVAAGSRINAWAVGSHGSRAFALHWNGTAWKG